jgi:hypothetical protein
MCFLNIILPGFGTIFSGCMLKSSEPESDSVKVAPEEEADDFDEEDEETKKKKEEEKKAAELAEKNKKPPVISTKKVNTYSRSSAFQAGIGQLLSAPFGLGWMWSIAHGLVLIGNARIYQEIEQIDLNL